MPISTMSAGNPNIAMIKDLTRQERAAARPAPSGRMPDAGVHYTVVASWQPPPASNHDRH
jgi:hypothetical protein